MPKTILKYHLMSFSILYVGVSLTRFACAIALYKITGSSISLITGLIVTFFPQVVSGLFVANILGKSSSRNVIFILTLCHSMLTLCMIAAFSHGATLPIYLLLFAKGFIFGVIDPTFKSLLATTSSDDENVRRRLSFRQGLVFSASIIANGLGAAWLEWGGISVILAIESIIVFQVAFTLKTLLGNTQINNSGTASKPGIVNLLRAIYLNPWLRILYLRSISDGISIIAIRAVLIDAYQLSPAKAGLYSSIIGVAAALGMFVAPFTPASKWNEKRASMLNSSLLPLCGLVLLFAYASTDVFYFILLYVFASVPYCLADMNIQSMPFINDPCRSGELAGTQGVAIAVGQITGIIITGVMAIFTMPALYGLAMFVFLAGSGLTSSLIRKSAYA